MGKQSLINWDGRHKSWAFWWSVGFGSGLLKPAPGTWGSLFGLCIGYILLQQPFALLALLGGSLVITGISTVCISLIEEASGIHDAPEIVVDEIAGQWVALAPLAILPYSWFELSISFFLFRLFDIWKPWPIGPLDKKVSGGFGVMIDDLVAGIFAAISLVLIIQIIL